MNSLLEIFLDLVKIDSPSRYEKEVRSYVFKFITRLGLKPVLDHYGNLIVKIYGIGRPILLGSHLDTVEPGRNIKPKIKNGIIKSDGTTILGVDNKVAVAALLEALKQITTKNIKSKALEIVFTIGEEVTDSGAMNLDYTKVFARQGYIFDSASSIGTIIIRSPFYNGFEIEIIGVSAHAAIPDKAVSTINIFKMALRNIELGRINRNTLVNIGVVQSGTVKNTIPGFMRIEGEVRSFSLKEAEFYSEKIVNVFQKASENLGGRIKYKVNRENPGYEHSLISPLIVQTGAIMKSIGFKPVLKSSWGCSDANFFNEHGIKVVNLGNGSKNPHTVKESVSIKDMEKLEKLILSLMTYKL